MIDPLERARIIQVARQHAVDYRFLAAIRLTENGRPGREFGVLIPGEDTWNKQANDAARTIRHTVGRFWKAMDLDPWDDLAGRYTEMFVRYLSRGGPGYEGYAQVGATNDPDNLNKNHAPNLSAFYRMECA